MSSALSRAQTGSLTCPIRMLYGTEERRRSRNMAAFGMFGMMSLLMGAAFLLLAERTLTLPAVEARRVFMVQAHFRSVPPSKAEQPEMKKILAQESDFLIPEEPEPVVEKQPEPQAVKKPEPKPEPEIAKPVRPKPEVKPAPKPKAKKVPRPIPKTEQALPARPVKEAEKTSAVSGGTGASVPAAAGTEKVENNRRSEVLAAILQVVEKHKRYPRQGRRSGAEGTCTLMVQVGADGRVASCTLAGPSGRAVLDAAAKRLGEKLLGLDVGSSGSIRVLIPVHYRLTDR